MSWQRLPLGYVYATLTFFLYLKKACLPKFTLLPYTTLFRSAADGVPRRLAAAPGVWRRPRHGRGRVRGRRHTPDRKSTRLNSSHTVKSYAVCCLKKKTYCTLPNAASKLP